MSILDVLAALLLAGLISAGLADAMTHHAGFLTNAGILLAEDSSRTVRFVKTGIASCRKEEASGITLFYCEQSEERGVRRNIFLIE